MFSVEELRDDLALVRRALDELHPSLTWYTPEAELERAFAAAAAGIRQPMTEGQFFELLQPVVVLVRCGHTYLETSRAFDDWRDRQPTSYLPFGVWADGERLFVLSNDSADPAIAPGDQLLAVNGIPAATIIARAKALIAADGAGETWKYVILNLSGGGNLKRFAFHSLGLREPFALVLLGRDGRQVTRSVTRKPAPDGGRPSGPGAPPSRRFELLANATARLTINRPTPAAGSTRSRLFPCARVNRTSGRRPARSARPSLWTPTRWSRRATASTRAAAPTRRWCSASSRPRTGTTR
jgi:hypothetical protein